MSSPLVPLRAALESIIATARPDFDADVPFVVAADGIDIRIVSATAGGPARLVQVVVGLPLGAGDLRHSAFSIRYRVTVRFRSYLPERSRGWLTAQDAVAADCGRLLHDLLDSELWVSPCRMLAFAGAAGPTQSTTDPRVWWSDLQFDVSVPLVGRNYSEAAP